MPQNTYVERAEMALVETIALEELSKNNEMKRDDVVRRIKDFGAFDRKVDDNFIRQCLDRLASDGHIEKQGEKLRITNDGKEDVRKIEKVMQKIRPSGR